MSEVDSSGDAKVGASPPGTPSPSEPPPSSKRGGFIGTNTDAVQAYVPPTALPETPEPPVPDTRVALAAEVDPRKAPTLPNLKKAAQAIASERPPPTIEAPPDSQASGIRRGSGYAPSRSNFPAPAPSSPRLESLRQTPSSPLTKAALRQTPATPLTKASLRQTPATPLSRSSLRPHPSEASETPQQRRAAIALIFLFAALLAVAVYFFLRRAPSPGASGDPATSTPSGAPTERPTSVSPSGAPAPSDAPSIAPSATGAAPSPSPNAPSPGPSGASSSSESVTATASSSAHGATDAPLEAPPATAPTSSATTAKSASSSAAPAASGPDKKSDRWF